MGLCPRIWRATQVCSRLPSLFFPIKRFGKHTVFVLTYRWTVGSSALIFDLRCNREEELTLDGEDQPGQEEPDKTNLFMPPKSLSLGKRLLLLHFGADLVAKRRTRRPGQSKSSAR